MMMKDNNGKRGKNMSIKIKRIKAIKRWRHIKSSLQKWVLRSDVKEAIKIA